MALLQCSFYSRVLGLQTELNAILPEHPGTSSQEPAVLYLLHGLDDDHSIWLRRTSIERYAEEIGLAVVMPQVHRSFYTDMALGGQYWTFLSEELPKVSERMLRITGDASRRFVAGNSMGGYGAFKWALRRPDFFAAAASLSGAMSSQTVAQRWPKEFALIRGGAEAPVQPGDDLFQLVEAWAQHKEQPQLPKLLQLCGTEDYLYEDNVKFKDHADKHGVAIDYVEEPGDHSWRYWDSAIQRVLSWLPKS